MNRKPLTILALSLGLAFVAASAATAGDTSYQPRNDSANYQSQDAKQPVAAATTSRCCQQSRCDRRCQRLLRMVTKRGCECPQVYYTLQPARANTYLSSHYPPFRYSR
jgi:hypothetical protein